MRSDIGRLSKYLIERKKNLGLTWEDVSRKLGKSPVYCAMLFYGYAQADDEEVKAVAELLNLEEKELAELKDAPYREPQQPVPPTDPFVYRLYEVVILYGPALKDVAHEMFGDGIMSAIDMSVELEKVEQEGAERMVLTFNGKWLKYRKF
ncbi:cyanase [Aquifex aeolicus]|uniref:Cyanate hydratase n=1 Tax=Aquifex aeolicus (strain VF5) TaxID=224324 RepID=CYNS_AQUAE|nr:cyanase [Aquifex aeolicus]O66587.1 RecName: Full=Cyanate hydratase; Short=Cyanase; AltName: Full=Cyanate hydrolase; AltName: Full=Cyanate lyase [Aquifex aeolicus VF5]AAC06548.1 cyanate hydrolase [Aquifex aeolicus VF5]